MTKHALREHYDMKYVHESGGSPIESIKKVHIPTTRFEAFIKFFPRYFKGGAIFELGAGNGNVAKTLLESNFKISNYTISDFSSTRLNGLRNRLNDHRLSIVKVDAEDIPKNEYGRHDAVIMIALIEHLVDPLRAMQQIRKLLVPGGFIYIDTPNIAKYTHRIKLLFGKFPSTASINEGLTTYQGEPVDLYDEGHLHYFTFNSLSRMLTERCGFNRVIKLGYPCGRIVLGKRVHNFLATIYPEMFSELAVIAYN